MWTRRAASALLVAAAAGGGARAADLALPGLRRAEVQALRRFCEATHPEGARAALSADWRARADDLADKADAMDLSRYAVEMGRLIGWFKDGHTALIIYEFDRGAFGLRLPVKTDAFHDGLYVTAAKDEAAALLGARITRLAGTPIEIVMQRFADAWPKANPAWAHRWAPLLLRTPGLLQGLGLVSGPDDAPILVEGLIGGGSTPVAVALLPRTGAQVGRIDLGRTRSALEAYAATQAFGPQPDATEDGRNFVWRMPGGAALYVCLDRVGDDDFSKPWAVFEREVFAALDDLGPGRLVIDLRRNGGGDNTLPEPLRHRIGRSHYNRPGGIYVLTSPQTFSAAQNLATRLERETYARFVGEPTGLSPNHCGDSAPFESKLTGLPIYVSTLRWQDMPPQDQRPWIAPDLFAPRLFSDWRSGHDAALEAALSDPPPGTLDDHSLTAPWERASQARAWTPFWMSRG